VGVGFFGSDNLSEALATVVTTSIILSASKMANPGSPRKMAVKNKKWRKNILYVLIMELRYQHSI